MRRSLDRTATAHLELFCLLMRYLVIACQSLSRISLKVELPPNKLLFSKVRLLFYPFYYINYKY